MECREIKINKSQLIKVSRKHDTMRVEVDNEESKYIYHFKYFGEVLARDDYCTRAIMTRNAIAKQTFNKQKMSLLTKKLNFELKTNCPVVIAALHFRVQRPI